MLALSSAWRTIFPFPVLFFWLPELRLIWLPNTPPQTQLQHIFFKLLIPIELLTYGNSWVPIGFVNVSAFILIRRQNFKLILFSVTRSRTRWYLVSTCFVCVPFASLLDMLIPPWLSENKDNFGLELARITIANIFPNKTHFWAAILSAMFPAYTVDVAAAVRFSDFHKYAPPTAKITHPRVDFRLVMQPAQSASYYSTVVNLQFCPSNLIPWVEISLINLKTFFRQVQRATVWFSMYWECRSTAKALSGLVQIIKFVKFLIACL